MIAGSAPVSTYRLQLHAGFGFAAAAEQVPYLGSLGISHLYLSPILQAVPGSRHGYDVVDHSLVSRDLGGEPELVRLADTAHRHGLGIVVDVVPNHMAVPEPLHLNRQLWQLLRDGPGSRFAQWFDVDWEHASIRSGELVRGKIGLPVLGRPLAFVVRRGELTLDEHEGQPVLRYYDQLFPVAPGTEGNDPLTVASSQHYVLDSWLNKATVLNYRRFFDVDTLIAVRVELPDVFAQTHAVLVDLHRRGVVDGFRIDHPDGLADPEGYLELLRDATGGSWVVAEKILEGDEELPRSWPTAGTTGYDAITAIAQALVPDTAEHLSRRWIETGANPDDLHAIEEQAKRDVIDTLFQPELRRLTRVAVRAAVDDGQRPHCYRDDQYAEELAELLAHVDSYRAYVRPGHDVDADSVERIHRLCDRAATSRPGMAQTFDRLRRLLLDSFTTSAAGRDLLARFGQTCGPVMAKGVEDTTFYRYHRLVALNEVGGDPSVLERPDPAAVHRWAQREAEHWPEAMTTLSTHDTKRSEDVRSRLLAAAGDPDGWDATWDRVRAAAQRLDVDLPTAYLVFQTLVGTWPIDEQRLVDYVRKAVREAKQHTAWTEVNEAYEERVFSLARGCLQAPIRPGVEGWLEVLRPAVRAMTLGTKLLELTLPGVPDTYQGTELVELSLVDPDNRRPVDYAQRAARLQRLDTGDAPRDLHDEKLLVTSRALRLRRECSELVTGAYEALATGSPHLLGFVRGGAAVTVVTRWPNGRSDWGAQTLTLPAGRWRDAFTGAVREGGPVLVRDLLDQLPVTLLKKDTA